ncbi:hypothetical protein HK096_008849, partial [Nowakowskiella sp. JEL0078]
MPTSSNSTSGGFFRRLLSNIPGLNNTGQRNRRTRDLSQTSTNNEAEFQTSPSTSPRASEDRVSHCLPQVFRHSSRTSQYIPPVSSAEQIPENPHTDPINSTLTAYSADSTLAAMDKKQQDTNFTIPESSQAEMKSVEQLEDQNSLHTSLAASAPNLTAIEQISAISNLEQQDQPPSSSNLDSPRISPTAQQLPLILEILRHIEDRPQSRTAERSNSRMSQNSFSLTEANSDESRNVALRLRISPESLDPDGSSLNGSIREGLLRELHRRNSVGMDFSSSRRNSNLDDTFGEIPQTPESEFNNNCSEENGGDIVENELDESDLVEDDGDDGYEDFTDERSEEQAEFYDPSSTSDTNSNLPQPEAAGLVASLLAQALGLSIRQSRLQNIDENRLDENSTPSTENHRTHEENQDTPTTIPDSQTETHSARRGFRAFTSAVGPEGGAPYFFLVFIPPNTMVVMTMRGGLDSQSLQGQPPASQSAINELSEVGMEVYKDEKCLICQEDFCSRPEENNVENPSSPEIAQIDVSTEVSSESTVSITGVNEANEFSDSQTLSFEPQIKGKQSDADEEGTTLRAVLAMP